MSNTSNDGINILDNINSSMNSNINLNMNNSSSNIPHLNNSSVKNSLSAQLIFFKEDILKDVKQFESKLNSKYNAEIFKNSNKMQKMQEKIEELSQKFDKINTSIKSDSNLLEKSDNLFQSIYKLEQALNVLTVRLKNLDNRVEQSVDKINKELNTSVIYPTVIGQFGKYKTFHEFIDFVILNINTLLIFKEKIGPELKEYKFKTDASINNFNDRLEYSIKNNKAFTSASIRNSEDKLNKVWEDKLYNESNKLKNNFEIFIKSQEKKILQMIENSDKINSLEKNIERIEGMEAERIEKKDKIKRKRNRKAISSILNNHTETSEMKGKNNYKLNEKIIGEGMAGVKKPISLVKKYIEGKIKDTELLYPKRQSVAGNYSPRIVNTNLKPYQDTFNNNTIHNTIHIISEKNIDSARTLEKKHSIKFEKSESSSSSSSNEETLNENNIQMEKERIKGEINKVLLKNARRYKSSENIYENESNKMILRYLEFLYKDKTNENNKESNLEYTPKVVNISINGKNDNQLIKGNENALVNNLYITNEKPISNSNSADKSKTIFKGIKSLDLSKINNPKVNLNSNSNINNRYKNNEVKDLIKQIKKKSRESLIPILPLNRLDKKFNNTLNSSNFIFNSRNKVFSLSHKNKNITMNQSNINLNNFSYNKIKPQVNLVSRKYNNDINKISMDLSNDCENDKQKDEEKMKKIFWQMKDVIQSDERKLIQNRFVKYGYNKDIIFSKEKKNK